METKRNCGLDIARIIAIFLVIMAHVYTDAYGLSNLNSYSLSTLHLLSGYSGLTLGRIGVPIFLMLTGYFLLSRTWTNDKIRKFFTKNFLRLLVTWEIWIIIYFLYNKLFNHMNAGVGTYIRQALFVKEVQMPNAWYMPMIIGIYLFLPYVALALTRISNKMLFLIMGILYVYLFVVPTLNQLASIVSFPPIDNQLELSYGGGYCAFYILIGYLIKRFKKDNISFTSKIFIFLLAIGLIIITVAFQIWTYKENKTYNVWYDFMTLPIIGGCIFTLLEGLKFSGNKKILLNVSDSSFGVFLIHYPILVILTSKVIHYRQNFFFLFILTVIVYLLSLLIVMVINKNKKIGVLLFFK